MPLTAAKIGLRSCRRVYSVRSKSWRCPSQSSLVMSLRWRRSLPTEKARSPAPVTMATRTAGWTAIVSKTSVSRAPSSVVIALSAWGRFRVMTATRPLPGEGQQGDGREDPADGVSGSVGDDQGPDSHEGTEAQKQQDLVNGILLEGSIGDREDCREDHADDEDRQHRPGRPGPAPAHGVASPPSSS